MTLTEAIQKTYNRDDLIIENVTLDLHQPWYLSTDWHLWIKDRKSTINGLHPVHCRENAEEILSKQKVDRIICLGDLVDDEFYEQFTSEEQDAIFGEMFNDIKDNEKYLIMGNNDHIEYKPLYEKYGFHVVDALIVNNKFLLTHYPVNLSDVPTKQCVIINIHGHYHGHGYYWTAPWKLHLDIWNKDRAPMIFKDMLILDKLREYKPQIKDIFHLHLKNKQEFIKYRGTNKTEDEI